jgi:hypothetical protein
MKYRWRLILPLALCFSYWPSAFAQPTAEAETEIDYLLTFVEVSGCEFYRNDSWYNSEQARAHLQKKYEYLSARDRIQTAENFIQLAATKSSMSGKPYEIRCGECTSTAASKWLTGVLLRYRTVRDREQESP